VPPTKEDFIAHAQVAFEGRVIGLRTNSGEVIAQDFDCDNEFVEHTLVVPPRLRQVSQVTQRGPG
jgi:hypothetical protein